MTDFVAEERLMSTTALKYGWDWNVEMVAVVVAEVTAEVVAEVIVEEALVALND